MTTTTTTNATTEEKVLKLYTKTICPKCILVKDTMARAEVIDLVEVINLDHAEHADKADILKEQGFMTLPVLEFDGKFYANQVEIMQVATSI